jgi:hypothetical protein
LQRVAPATSPDPQTTPWIVGVLHVPPELLFEKDIAGFNQVLDEKRELEGKARMKGCRDGAVAHNNL